MRALLLIPALAFLFVNLACNSSSGPSAESQKQIPALDNSPAEPLPTGTLITDKGINVGTAVSTTGQDKTLAIDIPGHPLNGFSLSVPANAYANNQAFNIKFQNITTHSFGPLVNPASPLISIDNGHAFASEPMTVQIPAKVPNDHIALGFYYNEETGTLEAMPTLDQTQDSVTVLTKHFSKIFVSSIQKATLLAALPIQTGFTPGRDDWQFPNYGSWLESGGHCAGQSISALWYFNEKRIKAKAPPLFGRYDNNGNGATPKLWQDDSKAYHLASVIQNDIDFNVNSERVKLKWQKANLDKVPLMFAYAMLVTRMPQAVGIFSKVGGGHEMLAYGIDSKQMYIADPNFPGNKDRAIPILADGSFAPYDSAANAADAAAGKGKKYETITFDGITGLIDFSAIEKRWQAFEAGESLHGKFPSCSFVVIDKDGNEIPYTPGMKSEESVIKVAANCNAPSNNNKGKAVLVYFDSSTARGTDVGNYAQLNLSQGNNTFDFGLYSKTTSPNGDVNYNYIDFERLSIEHQPKPVALSGYVFKEIRFKDGDFKLGNQWVQPGWVTCTGSLQADRNVESANDFINASSRTSESNFVVMQLAKTAAPQTTQPVRIRLTRACSSIWKSFEAPLPNGGSVRLENANVRTVLEGNRFGAPNSLMSKTGTSGEFSLTLEGKDLNSNGSEYNWSGRLRLEYDYREVYTLIDENGKPYTQYGAWKTRSTETANIAISAKK